jgi:hypothetical protein
LHLKKKERKKALTIELPRNIIDDKGQSNADAKYTVHVDGKDATFQETSNNPNSRTCNFFMMTSIAIKTRNKKYAVHMTFVSIGSEIALPCGR